MLTDTQPAAERMQLELLRRFSPGKRARLALSLSDVVISSSKRAIKLANPDLDEPALKLRFIALNYGNELAERVRLHLERRRK